MNDDRGWLQTIQRTVPGWPLLLVVPLVLWMVISPFGLLHADYDLPETVEFNRDIRPILSEKCFACHGPDAEAREANLRLDTEEGAKKMRADYEHPAVVPGSPEESALIQRITHSDPEKRMPPPSMTQEGSGGKSLTGREIALFRKWIEQGAPWEKWWAYAAVERPDVPAVEAKGPAEVRNPVDRFVLARLKEKGLSSTGPADRATLLRRLSLDLTGLPPTVDEVRAFVRDGRPDAYRQKVDSLLASRHFGERMAIWWLDLVRYAETDGYHSDLHRDVSAYRDYVIRAFNENKPFDQFTREQIAGDLLPSATREQEVAAAYNRLGQATKEGGSQPKEYLFKYAVDRVTTISNAWLASSMQCAQCHDHKYDPFTQEDFYSMAAFFGDVKERGMFPNENQLPPERSLLTREEADSLRQFNKKIAHLEGDVERALRSDRTTASKGERLNELRKERGAFVERNQEIVQTVSVESRAMRLHPRGDWRNDSGPYVTPDQPDFLPEMDVTGRRPDRLDLANWLVADDNPLTPRAFVNQLWEKFFGHGLSKRLGDFGVQGEAPTHPKLLDWLAAEFVESGWDVKHVVRLIVTSATYRKSSQSTETHLEEDPNNRYLAHQARFRLPAELVRDNALAISGLLNRDVGGESFKPYQPEGYWSDIQTFGETGPAAEWTATTGPDQYRRGLYIYWKRSFLHPTLKAFNASTRQATQAHRTQSNDPRQSLALLNDPMFVEAARVFAERILEEETASVEARVRWALRRAVSRAPTDAEVRELVDLYRTQLERYQGAPDAARPVVSVGQYPVAEDKPLPELAAWTSVARAILNLHETITRY